MTSGLEDGGRGHSLVETVAVLAVSGLLAAMALPSLAGIVARSRMRAALAEVGVLVRTLRSRAVAEGRSLALVIDRDAAGWRYAVHADGDGDGVRAEDIADRTDPLLESPMCLGELWGGVDFGFLPLPRIRRLPPSTAWMSPSADPVQFGSTDIVSFSPQGDASSGTFYLTDGRNQMGAVVLYGPSVRVRLYRYDTAVEEWLP